MITNELLNDLEQYLKENIQNLVGELLNRNNGYDALICNILTEFDVDTSRYWDAKWTRKNLYIEFKKGKSIWLDLVRYSEILLKENDEARKETITLFFIPNSDKTHIEKIIGMKTSSIIEKLNLDENKANFIIELNKSVPRSLNAQASLTVNDVKQIADFIVINE